MTRRHLLQIAGAGALISAAGATVGTAQQAYADVIPPARSDVGVSAYAFNLGQVRLTAARFLALHLSAGHSSTIRPGFPASSPTQARRSTS